MTDTGKTTLEFPGIAERSARIVYDALLRVIPEQTPVIGETNNIPQIVQILLSESATPEAIEAYNRTPFCLTVHQFQLNQETGNWYLIGSTPHILKLETTPKHGEVEFYLQQIQYDIRSNTYSPLSIRKPLTLLDLLTAERNRQDSRQARFIYSIDSRLPRLSSVGTDEYNREIFSYEA